MSIPSSNSLGVKTREIFFAFILAKGISLSLVYCLIGGEGNPEYLVALSHAISLLLFFVLLMVATKQSANELVGTTRLRSQAWGKAWVWLVISVPLGFLFRFGSEGIILNILHLYDPSLALDEFNDAISDCPGASSGLGILVVLMVVIGAIDEEFIYRRVFQWHFCSRIGAIKGIAVVSLIFGAIHLNPVAILAAVFLSLVYIVSGRLWVAIVVHAAGNLLHPLIKPLLCVSDWKSYLALSAFSSALLLIFFSYVLLEVRKRLPLYFEKSLIKKAS